LFKLEAQTFFVCRLKESGSELTMNFYREADDPLRQQVIFARGRHRLSPSHCLTGE
jgi:hypothetical protein